MPVTKATVKRLEERMKAKYAPEPVRCFMHFQEGTVEYQGTRYPSPEAFKETLKDATELLVVTVYSWERDGLYMQSHGGAFADGSGNRVAE